MRKEEVDYLSKQYLIVIPTVQFPAGKIWAPEVSLPLHVTVMSWFELQTEVHLAQLRKLIWDLARDFSKHGIILEAARKDYFGPDRDLPVSVLKDNPILNLLHTTVLCSLASRRFRPKNIQWIGAGYRAHVSDHEGLTLEPGEKVTATQLVLIERDEHGHKRVVECADLALP